MSELEIKGIVPLCQDCAWWILKDFENLKEYLDYETSRPHKRAYTDEEIERLWSEHERPNSEFDGTEGQCCLNPIRIITHGGHFCSHFKYEPTSYGPYCHNTTCPGCKGTNE
jgi:hypothetical protein